MRKWMMLLWVVVMVTLGIGCYVENAESKEFNQIGKIYVGEFEKGSSDLSSDMFRQILEGLNKLPSDLELSIALRAYTDNSGTEEKNRVLLQERLRSLEKALGDILVKINIVDVQACIYESGKNEVDRRFAVIEIFVPAQSVLTDFELMQSLADSGLELSTEIGELVTKINSSDEATKLALESLTSKMDVLDKSVAEEQKSIQADSLAKKRLFWLIICLVLLVLVVAILSWRTSCNQARVIEKISEHRHVKVVKTVNGIQTKGNVRRLDKTTQLEVATLEGKFLITCWHGINEDGSSECYYSPFLSIKGKWIIRYEKLMIKSLRACMKNDDYKTQRGNLEVLNWIKKKS